MKNVNIIFVFLFLTLVSCKSEQEKVKEFVVNDFHNALEACISNPNEVLKLSPEYQKLEYFDLEKSVEIEIETEVSIDSIVYNKAKKTFAVYNKDKSFSFQPKDNGYVLLESKNFLVGNSGWEKINDYYDDLEREIANQSDLKKELILKSIAKDYERLEYFINNTKDRLFVRNYYEDFLGLQGVRMKKKSFIAFGKPDRKGCGKGVIDESVFEYHIREDNQKAIEITIGGSTTGSFQLYNTVLFIDGLNRTYDSFYAPKKYKEFLESGQLSE